MVVYTSCSTYSHEIGHLSLSLSLSLSKCNGLLQRFVLPFMRASRLALDASFNAIHPFSDPIVSISLTPDCRVFALPIINTRCNHVRLLSCSYLDKDGAEGLISTVSEISICSEWSRVFPVYFECENWTRYCRDSHYSANVLSASISNV